MDITDVAKLWRGYSAPELDKAPCDEVTKTVARLLLQAVASLLASNGGGLLEMKVEVFCSLQLFTNYDALL